MIGVEGVAQSEGVGEYADSDGEDRMVAADVVVPRNDEAEQDSEAQDVQDHDERGHAGQAAPVTSA